MGNNVVITIGREFGSGGREIGKKVADRLGIKFYDKELLQEAAKESGFCREIFENQDENGYIFHKWLFIRTVFRYALKS